jgi:hypothetical protein
VKPDDIIQINPNHSDDFGGCLATVREVKDNGRLLVYIQSAAVKGQAYLFVREGQYESTGGRAVWVIGSADSEGGEV